jgi:hypothetical protein
VKHEPNHLAFVEAHLDEVVAGSERSQVVRIGLDEQAMLLRALEERTFLPLGSDEEAHRDFSSSRAQIGICLRPSGKVDFAKICSHESISGRFHCQV